MELIENDFTGFKIDLINQTPLVDSPHLKYIVRLVRKRNLDDAFTICISLDDCKDYIIHNVDDVLCAFIYELTGKNCFINLDDAKWK